MTILITGAGGFIGKNLTTYLGQYYELLSVFSKKSKKVGGKSIVKLNLENTEECLNYFSCHYGNVDLGAIIHLASYLPMEKEVEDIKVLLKNINIANTVLGLSKLLNPSFILNFSSIAVYPNRTGTFKEESEIKPSINTECYYGLSKFCSENILDFGLRNMNIKICHIRLAQTYGHGMNETRLIPTMLKELNEHNCITVYGDGERTSVFLSIEELRETIKRLLEIMPVGIFNVGFHNLRYIDLANKIIQKFGNKGSRVIKIAQGNRSKFQLDTSNILQTFKQNNISIKLNNNLL